MEKSDEDKLDIFDEALDSDDETGYESDRNHYYESEEYEPESIIKLKSKTNKSLAHENESAEED